MAMNEELQSTDEKLVGSKEELQSLDDKIVERGTVNDDLANFLNSIEVGAIFLDRTFCIRRFTPSATKLMNLVPLDLGRPVSHASNTFIDTDLIAIADGVLKTSIRSKRMFAAPTDAGTCCAACLIALRKMSSTAWSSPSPTSPA
jgi:hypothetical protein